jgi:hypothetical protein
MIFARSPHIQSKWSTVFTRSATHFQTAKLLEVTLDEDTSKLMDN